MKLKKALRLTAMLVFIHVLSFAQKIDWVNRAGLWAFDYGYGICTDKSGNVYVAGKYEMNAEFGGIPVTCAGNHDIFVAKYNSSGVFQWVRTAGGDWGDYAHAVTCDEDGNVYLTGEMETTTYFGNIALTSNGGNDIFVAKYNTNGDLQWAKKLGGSSDGERGYGITCSKNAVYVTGYFQKNANLGGYLFNSAGDHDLFLAKYTAGGSLLWVKGFGGTGKDQGKAIRIDEQENIYLTGFFSNAVDFGGVTLKSSGAQDIFLAKYNSGGNLLWAKKAGSGSDDYGLAIARDANGIYLTGGITATCYFNNIAVASAGGQDIFIARYSLDGNIIWAKSAGGADADCGRGIAVDGNSNIYLTGNYGFNAMFDYSPVTGTDYSEIFFASYDPNGKFRWVTTVGGEADPPPNPNFPGEMGMCIATDPAGNVVASGNYRNNSVFGTTKLTKYENTDIFVVKIKQSSLLAVITPAGSPYIKEGGSVLLQANTGTGYTYSWKKDGVVISGATGSTYNAKEEGDYTVTISNGTETAVSSPVAVKTMFMVHFRKPSSWPDAKIHYWYALPSGSYPGTSWPGLVMTPDPDFPGWYSFSLPNATCANLVLNNGNGTVKTSDLNLCGEGWYDGFSNKWVSKPGTEKTVVIHFKKPSSWPEAKIHYWYAVPEGSYPNTTWPGIKMNADASLGTDWYTFSLPNATCTNFVVNNGNGSVKTSDLNICGEGWYDGSVNRWVPKPGTEKPVVVHFKKPASWPDAKIHYWYAVPDGSYPSTNWPGISMDPDPASGSGWYMFSLPKAYCTNLLFNNGNGSIKTPDLNLCGEGWYDNGWVSAPSPRVEVLSGTDTSDVVTGINVDSGESQLLIAPNPAKDFISVNYRFQGEKNISVKVLNLFGQEVFKASEKVHGEYSGTIKNNGWKSGLYIVVVSDGLYNRYRKIYVE